MRESARRRFAAALLAAALLVCSGPAAGTAGPAPRLPAELPLDGAHRVRQVADAATVSTRVEAEPFPARRELFEFLLDHPEFATHVTRALKLARYRIWRAPDGLWLDDGWGTRGRFELVHAASGLRLLHAWGKYDHWFFPSIAGEAVVMIEYASRAGANGRDELATVISGYVKLANPLLAAAGRLARSVAMAKAEKEGHRLARVFARCSRAVEENPAAVYELLRQRPDVPPDDLEAFRRLVKVPKSTP